EAWEQALSRFRSDSELCQLNCQPGLPIAVSQVLWDVFAAASQAEVETRGLVNPLIADSLVSAGYDRSFDLLRTAGGSEAPIATLLAVPALSDVVSNPIERTLQVPGGARLDFGGVAKGWAAQMAMLSLAAYGPALFSAGGDLAVSGPRADGKPWTIGVDDPFRPGDFIEHIYLERGGVATSGKDHRRWMRGGTQQHHIIDPRTGLPAETDVLTATVIAPDAMLAEAFAKAVVISGSEAGLAWLDSDERLAGLLILDNGQRLNSRNMDLYL
ncbi:MAG: FAD:protein FMN transferase, partial [Bacteroidota bacterium]